MVLFIYYETIDSSEQELNKRLQLYMSVSVMKD